MRRAVTLVSGGDNSTAEGAGLNAREHRQDCERLPAWISAQGLTPHGVSSQGTSLTRLNQAADNRIPVCPEQVSVDGPQSPTRCPAAAGRDAFPKEFGVVSSPCPEGESPWTTGCAGRFGGQDRTTGADRGSEGIVMPGVDQIRARRERDKPTVAEVCADLGISRWTFYEWRVKGRAPKCIALPNGSLRVRRFG